MTASRTRTLRTAWQVLARGVLVVLLWAAGLLASPAPQVAAHAFLESSDPAANAVVATAPSAVTLRFTEPLEPSYSKAELFDQTGAVVAGASSNIGPDAKVMTVTLPYGLQNGTYSLLWRTLSTVDGHTAQGYLPFTIGSQSDVQIVAPPVTNAATSAIPEWLLAAARWLALLALTAVAGIWPTWVFVIRPALSPAWQLGPKVTRRVRGYASAAVVAAVVANIVALIVQAASIAGTDNLLSGLQVTIGQTRYGTWWLIRVGLLLVFSALLLGVSWWRPWQRKAVTIVTILMAAALPIPFSMISHAGAEPQGQAVTIAFDWVHLLAASLWIGGLLLMVVALPPTMRALTAEGRRVILSRAIPRFSTIALIAWGCLLFTGLYSAWLQVGNLTALTTTPYGQTLILKLILLAPLLALGAFNLLLVTRKLREAQSVERVEGWSGHFVTALIAEVVVVTLLLGVVGLLIGTPPARSVLVQESGRLRIPLSAEGQIGSLVITPGTVGQNHYRLELGTGHEAHLRNPAVTDATLRFELPSQQTGQIDLPLRQSPSGGYEAHGSELAFPGDWRMQVTVRMPGQPDWVVAVEQPISNEAPASDLPPPPPLFGVVGIVALLLMVIGVAGIVLAVQGAAPRFRMEAGGLGALAILVGLVLLWQARLPATQVEAPTSAMAAAVALGTIDPVAIERGKAVFAQSCVVCHGPTGKGDGPGGASLKTKPADLTAGHSLLHTDEDYTSWIENGIAGTDMPGFSGTLDSAQVSDVVTYVRSLQQAALLARNAPGPEECTVAPRTLDQIEALAQAPAPQEAPNATESGGAPADQSTTEAISATVRQMVACSNAGDILRRLAIYSDNRIHFAYPEGPTPALRAIAANPLPLSQAERVALVSVDDVRQLDDGRVMAQVIVENPANHTHDPRATTAPNQQEAARLIFVQEGGAWRVDETRREEIPPGASPARPATPVAATPVP